MCLIECENKTLAHHQKRSKAVITIAKCFSLALYGITGILITMNKTHTLKYGKAAKNIFCLLAILVYGLVLYRSIDTPNGHNLNAYNMIAMIMWIVTIVLLLVNYIFDTDSLLLFSIPILISTMSADLIFSSPEQMYRSITASTTAHILLALFSISMLAITGLQAAVLSLQNYMLKKNPLHPIHHLLHPMEHNEKVWVFFVYISFAILTATLCEAFIYLNNTHAISVKLLFSVTAWLVLFVILWKHYNTGYKGVRSEMWSILALALLAWAYFGSKIFLGYQ